MPAEVINATEKNKLAVHYYVRALALGIPAIFLGLQIAGWIGFVRIIADGHGDFRQLYIAGYMMRSGHAHELYEYSAQKRFQDELISREQIALPFNHLAHEALLYAPFSVVRYQVGYCAFLVFNLAVLAFSYRLLRPYLSNLAQVYGWLPWVLLVTFLPVGIAAYAGAGFSHSIRALDRNLCSAPRAPRRESGVVPGAWHFQVPDRDSDRVASSGLATLAVVLWLCS